MARKDLAEHAKNAIVITVCGVATRSLPGTKRT